ncbi:MAG: outer membrane beta-barrel protein [Prevotella sp.]|jgi:hypothetical protein|nr:outer membrane beta-barrel protein [Prevotella sp.]
MKKIITLLTLSLCVLSAYAEDITSLQDTIVKTVKIVIEQNPATGSMDTIQTESQTLIPEKENESNILLGGSSYNFLFSWKKKKHLSPHWTGFGMGFMNYDDIPNGSLKMSKSHNFTVNLFDFHKQIGKSNWLVVSGIGAEWSRYHFDENAALTKVDGRTTFQPAPEGIDYKSTKLLAYYITIPLLLEYQISNFHVSGGVVGFFKYYSKSQVKYYVDNEKVVKNMGRDLNIRPVDMKLRLQVGINDISVYAYYSPFSMFGKDKGPDLKTYTIGVMLGI